MNSAPLVSIVIPMYNLEKYIARCLDSALAQTMTSLEIICVDDGSRDKTGEIVRQYRQKDPRISLYTQENAGQAVARNNALEHCRGKYVYFLDGDDSITPDMLEKACALAEEHQLDLVSFDITNTYESDDLRQRYPQYLTSYQRHQAYPGVMSGKTLFKAMSAHQEYFCAPPSYLFSRAFLTGAELKFYSGIIHEDELFTLQAFLRAERAAYLPEKLFCRLVREGSTMTQRTSIRNVNGYLTVGSEISRELSRHPGDAALDKTVSALAARFLRQGATLFQQLEPAEQERCCWPRAQVMTLHRVYDDILSSKTYRVGQMVLKPIQRLRSLLSRRH